LAHWSGPESAPDTTNAISANVTDAQTVEEVDRVLNRILVFGHYDDATAYRDSSSYEGLEAIDGTTKGT